MNIIESTVLKLDNCVHGMTHMLWVQSLSTGC